MVHDPYFFTDLVDEHRRRPGFGNDPGEFPQGLAHEPGLEAHMGIPHIPFDFRFGHQGRHRVDDDDVDGTAAHQGVTDFQGLFPSIRLGNQQVVDVHSQVPGIFRIQGVFRIDESRIAAPFLGFGDHVQGHGGLPGRFRSVDLNDPAPGNPPDPQCNIQGQGPGGNGFNIHFGAGGSQLHDGSLAEILFDLFQGRIQRFIFLRIQTHVVISLYHSCSI